jgi:hypothetical protein
MKIKINTKIISKLDPCANRFENWKRHYGNVETIDALQFLELDKISYQDKLWVLLRLVPRDVVEYFVFDMAVDAAANAAAAAAAADAYAANAAAAAAKNNQRKKVLDTLAYLIQAHKEEN